MPIDSLRVTLQPSDARTIMDLEYRRFPPQDGHAATSGWQFVLLPRAQSAVHSHSHRLPETNADKIGFGSFVGDIECAEMRAGFRNG